MLQKVLEFVDRHEMLAKQDKIIVGISGGADSVCLLCVLKELAVIYELSIEAVHVNHMLRGQEADEDQAFTETLCRQLQIPCTVYRYPVADIARTQGLSLEEAGRKVRYEAFYQRQRETGAKKIAVAHQMDDRAETMLFHLFRGSGLKGLGSIRPVGKLPAASMEASEESILIRPLLCLSRRQIEQYLGEKGIPFREDSSNGEDGYTRNKIRHHVLSYVREQIAPQAVENMDRAASRLAEIDDYLQKTAAAVMEETTRMKEGQVTIPVEAFCRQDPVIRKIMARQAIEAAGGSLKDITARHIDNICSLSEAEVGKYLMLPGKMAVSKTYEDLVFAKNTKDSTVGKAKFSEIQVAVPGSYYIEETGEIVEFTKKSYNKDQKIPNSPCTKWFDYDKIKNPLWLRTRRTGDFLTVTADGGTKKLKDYFIDCKLPREMRDRLPLLAEENHVLWVFDLRISEGFKVTEETRTILEVKRKREDTKDE